MHTLIAVRTKHGMVGSESMARPVLEEYEVEYEECKGAYNTLTAACTKYSGVDQAAECAMMEEAKEELVAVSAYCGLRGHSTRFCARLEMSDGEEGMEDNLPLLGRFTSLKGRWEEKQNAELKVAAGVKNKGRARSRMGG